MTGDEPRAAQADAAQRDRRGPSTWTRRVRRRRGRGWIRVGPRTTQDRILHTRAITAATEEDLDDASVWAVTCFVVRREYRGTGLNAQMLDAALDYARESGARIIEAYPVDTSEGTHHSNDLFHGTVSTFLSRGFRTSAPLTQGRVLVVRELK